MSFSLCYCPGCMKALVENMCSEPVSVVFQSSGRPTRYSPGPLSPDGEVFQWVNSELHLYARSLSWTLKNQQRLWIFGASSDHHSVLIPWLGRLPYSFARVRAPLLSKLASARLSGLSRALMAITIPEYALEI
eukprot:8538142-Pyramimonas_sp.AAC.1